MAVYFSRRERIQRERAVAKLGDYIGGGGTIFSALVDARAAFGARKLILEDQDRNPLSYTDLIRAAFALGRRIAALTEKGERVGVMLPASSAGVVTMGSMILTAP